MVLDREFPPDTRVENEIEALVNAGHQVNIACYTLKNRKSEELANNFKIFRKPISKFVYKSSVGCLKFPFYFNFWRNFLNEIFNKETYDAIHIHDLPLAIIGYEFKNKYNIPLTIDLHENWPAYLRMSVHTNTVLGRILSSNKQWEKYEKRMCNVSDNIIVVVDESKQRLIQAGIQSDKISVVSNTLNLDHFILLSESKPNTQNFTFFYAGGINYHRGIQNVIIAIQEVIKEFPQIQFQILGEGSYKSKLIKLASDLSLDNNIKFLGWKSFNEMIQLLGKSDIALIPHLKSDHTDSTIPHKLFQYMFAEKPIIASNCAPIERIINETKTGIIYQHDSTEELAKKLKYVIANSKKLHDLYPNGKNAVLDKYNWETDKKQLLKIYSN